MVSQTKRGHCETRLQKEEVKQEIYSIRPVGVKKQPFGGGHGTQPVLRTHAYPVFSGRAHMKCRCPIPSGFSLINHSIIRIKHSNLKIAHPARRETRHCNIPSFITHTYTSRLSVCVTQYQHMRIYHGCEPSKRPLRGGAGLSCLQRFP